MKSGDRVCGKCGSKLFADAPKGLCSLCLYNAAVAPLLEEALESAQVPNKFGDFEITRCEDGSLWELGRGGMGVTYLAVDNVLRRKVALKVINVPAVARTSHPVRERFLREARAAAALRHPNVAAVYRFGASPDDSHCYYAMELVEGETLEARVRREGPLNPKPVLEIAMQITRALMAAAAHGLIHRDLKPGNIMLTGGDAETAELEVKVIDFGLAKAIADAGGEMDLTHGGFVGTPNFASPEQFESGPVDVRSDIYSLGATIWFALTGKTPFAGSNIEEIRSAQKSNALSLEELKAAHVPLSLRSLLRSMLALKPAARPGIHDLAAQLRRCSALADIEIAADVKKEIQLEIAHVLFIDIVGYSKLSINEQQAAVNELTQIVRSTEQFQKAEAAERLIKIPSGDGMALVFYTSPDAPVRCAMQIGRTLKGNQHLHIRMGIHSGPVSGVVDVAGGTNLAGAGLNLAQRVMKCGDTGHILLSKRVAEDLSEFDEWRPLLHDLGRCEVKHGVQVAVVSLWSDDVGNRQLPQAFQTLRKHRVRLRWVEVSAALLLLAGIAIAFVFVSKKSAISTAIAPEKTVAVLPFENLSEDKANAYFAEGIQDEILTRLAKISDLKVISRTSTQRYQSKPGNLAEIGKQLGVANILEGSVQKVADQVRLNVQLINAQTDSHLWAESYDRKLTDILGVESEIAKGIAESMQAKLTGREEQALAVKPTNNPEAYDAYLRGLAFEARGNFFPDLVRNAVGFLERAVQLDPSFAIAWARLSRMNAYLYFNGSDNTPVTRRDEAKRALENAQKLEPNAPETLVALGYYQYQVLRDYGLAKATLGRVSKMLPSNGEVPNALALITRREGSWDQSTGYFEQALALDPRNVDLLMDAASTYAIRRQFSAALKLYDRVLDITPNDPEVMASKASIYQAQGNLQQAARLLSDISWQTPPGDAFAIKIIQLRLERNYDAAIQLLRAREAQFHFPSDFEKAADQVWLAFMQRLAGDTAGAKITAEQARNALKALCENQPQSPFLAQNLSVANTMLGDKDSALKEAERAVMLQPRAQDAINGPAFEENLAFIQMIFGENSRAISTLALLLQTPYEAPYYGRTPVTPALLRLDPVWDPLRGDPRFEALVQDVSASKKGVAESAEQVPASPESLEKSIAVLPFENLSRDPDNAYFAEGIQEEILTRLSKIAALKVISRTSTQQYRSKPGNVSEIAKQLGVGTIVEGSVQKVADQVRVNVQLINAQTDSHLWADTYDRKLTDILSVESEVAKAIAGQLRAKLTGQEEEVISAKPTDNPDAYDAYLRGLAYNLKTAISPPNSLGAQKYLREAVRLDPKFALAWALLSYVDSLGYLTASLQQTIALREEARQAAETALTLQPNLGEALYAKGYYYYACLKDHHTAMLYFEKARQLLPNSSQIPQTLANVAQRRGEWDRTEAYFNEAERLDPRNVSLLMNRVVSYTNQRRFTEALQKLDQILNITPDDVDTLAAKANILQAQGDLPGASAILEPLRPSAGDTNVWETKVYQAIFERRPAVLIPQLKEILVQPDPALGFFNGELRFWLGLAQEVAGDHAAAQESWHRARSELEPLLREQPKNWLLLGDLALTNAYLGDKAAALALAERCVAANPVEKDAVDGPMGVEYLARVAARIGESDRAITALQKLLSIPYEAPNAENVPLTPALLRLDPMFDPLRNDPRFQKLCEEKQK